MTKTTTTVVEEYETYFAKPKEYTIDHLEITEYPHSHKQDDKNKCIYWIVSIKNLTSNAIFANVHFKIMIDPDPRFFHFTTPMEFDSARMKRLKHPEFYTIKPVETLFKIVFPIKLVKQDVIYETVPKYNFTILETKTNLDYIYPKSTHYYIIRAYPTNYRPMSEKRIDMGVNGVFL